MRSSGPLAAILAEMRGGRLSDGTWTILQERVLGVVRGEGGKLCRLPGGETDARLSAPPFNNHRIHYILHRHVLRDSQSYANALRETVAHGRRLYIVTASDDVRESDAAKFTAKDALTALRLANLRDIKYLSGFLPLYVGMHLLLFGKACVQLSLMNGCECRLERLVLADEEPEFQNVEVGVPTELKYMPAGLLLRALDVDWMLPTETLPPLPRGFDRRGLFLLRPSTDYIPLTTAAGHALQVRRVQFSVVPASTRIVYNAQGEGFDAVVADLARPPNMTKPVHFLSCYVMLSRAKTLEGLLILRLASREQLSAGAPQYILDAIDRLLECERETTEMMKQHLLQFQGVLPSEVLGLFDESAAEKELEEFETAGDASNGSVHTERDALDNIGSSEQTRSRGALDAAYDSPAAMEKNAADVLSSPPDLQLEDYPHYWDNRTAGPLGVRSPQDRLTHTRAGNAFFRFGDDGACADTLEPSVVQKRRDLETQAPECMCEDDSLAETVSVEAVSPGGAESTPEQNTFEEPSTEAVGSQIRLSSSTAHELVDVPCDIAEVLGYVDSESTTNLKDNHKGALLNAGNTCYLNALLHVLARVTKCREWFQQHLKNCGESHAGQECPLCSIAEDVNRLCVDVDATPFLPAIVRARHLWSHGAFADSEQQDVTEAVQLLFDSLNAVDERAASSLIPEALGADLQQPLFYTTPRWKAMEISFESRLRCCTCGCSSSKKERLFYLLLDLRRTTSTIEKLLSDHWGDQPVEEGTACPAEAPCASGSDVRRSLRPCSWPRVLVLILKRWILTDQYGAVKDNTEVRFETILHVKADLAPYHLRGVIEHHGRCARAGHYTAFVRPPDNHWYHCDDNRSPRRVPTEAVLDAQAYVLVYES